MGFVNLKDEDYEACKNNLTACNSSLSICNKDLNTCKSSLIVARIDVEHLSSLLNPQFDLTEPMVVGNDFIDAALAEFIPNYSKEVIRIYMDSTYYIPTDEEIIEFILWEDVNEYQYIKEKLDCDKFAAWFWGRYRILFQRNNCGFVVDWSGGHAYNIFVRQNGVWLYEPQNDRWMDAMQPEDSIYPLTNARVIL